MLRRAALTTAALAVVLVTAGCIPTEPQPAPTSTPRPTASPAPTASSTPTPSPTASPEAGSRPLGIACDALVTLQAMYDYNPNFSLLGDLDAAAGTLAGDALAAQGVACRWVNDTSGETIDVAAADLTGPALAQKRTAAGEVTSAFGVEGYFRDGEAQAISGSYWITVVSPGFLEPADAAPIVQAAVAALG